MIRVICNKSDWDCINIDYAEKKLSLCKHCALHVPVFSSSKTTRMDEGEFCEKKQVKCKCIEVTGLDDEAGNC
jgi:hypothetical protein